MYKYYIIYIYIYIYIVFLTANLGGHVFVKCDFLKKKSKGAFFNFRGGCSVFAHVPNKDEKFGGRISGFPDFRDFRYRIRIIG